MEIEDQIRHVVLKLTNFLIPSSYYYYYENNGGMQ